ncbi:MAG: patatin family protein [Bacteroides sp.]|nr:patatin family protein [Roseburia sp.]MCM1461519.1 patatin family protein [Bacteroides sp.]
MKIGFVLEGGASRTAFTCGVLDLFLDREFYLDYVIGASAGICYGVSYSSRQRGRNRAIFEKYVDDPRYMGIKHLLGKGRCYYNLDFVFGEIPGKLLPYSWADYEKYGSTGYAVLTNIETGRPEYLRITEKDEEWTALRASCALPILFPPIFIDGKAYMDGGITDSIPFQKALDDGCERVVVVLTRERGYIKKKESLAPLVKLLYPRYPALAEALSRRHEMYGRQRKALSALEKAGKALVIAPDSTHGIKRTERRPSVLLPFYEEGYRTAERSAEEIKSFLG